MYGNTSFKICKFCLEWKITWRWLGENFLQLNHMNILSGFVKFAVEMGHKYMRIMYELLFVCIH
jgi:hypothetical protein